MSPHHVCILWSTAGAAPRILKRTTQTALVWTMYEELVPRITQLGYAAKAAWEERAAEQRR